MLGGQPARSGSADRNGSASQANIAHNSNAQPNHPPVVSPLVGSHPSLTPNASAPRTSYQPIFNTGYVSGNSTVFNIGGDYYLFEGPDEAAVVDTSKKVSTIRDIQMGREIHVWLGPPDSSPNHNAARKECLQGTGLWLTDAALFKEWMQQPDRPLWLYGGPGCGKTILCSTIIEKTIEFCKSEPLAGYAYFYFDSRNMQAEFSLHEKLIRSLITQLSDRCDGIPAALADMYRTCDNGHRQPSIDLLKNTLMRIINGFDKVYIIIDSLDECSDRSSLLKWIQSIASASRKLHLLVASRPEPDIKRSLAFILGLESIHVGGKSTDEDIDKFIDAQLSEMDDWSTEALQEIKSALVAGAGGMFRWVALQLGETKECLTLRELRKNLKSMPKGLNGIYEKILARSRRRVMLKVFLQWLAFSAREMTVNEVAEVAAVDLWGADGPRYDPDLRYKNPIEVLSICSGLVTEVEGCVKLAHFSVKEYLMSESISAGDAADFRTNERLSHALIAHTCLVYLMIFNQADSITPNNIALFPLIGYAAVNWTVHFLRAESHNCENSRLLSRQLFDPARSYAFLNWVRVWNPDGKHHALDLSNSSGDIASPLYYASLTGIIEEVQYMVNNNSDVNAIGGSWNTALHAAASRGHDRVVKLLLEHGANVNSGPNGDSTAMYVACWNGYCETVKLLLEHGADLAARANKNMTALHLTSVNGRTEIAKLLLEHGADFDAKTDDGTTVLHLATYNCRTEIVKLLLDRGVDFAAKGDDGVTALYVAISMGHTEIATLLLEHGADPDAKNNDDLAALQLACENGHGHIVKLLLEHGADPNAKESNGITALHLASSNGYTEIVKLLLEHGADLRATANDGATALHMATLNDDTKVVTLLLEHDADLDAKANDGRTALHTATLKGNAEIVKLLLEHGANLAAKANNGMTALHVAVSIGYTEIVTLLLEHDVEFN